MDSIQAFCRWLEQTTLADAVAGSTWAFPTIETVHVLALTLVVGSIAILDLRLLGLSTRNKGILELTDETLPWTWGAFMIAAISGGLMFMSSASRYFGNVPFRIKMVLMLLAGLNMAIFHFTAFRGAHQWNYSLPTPVAARIAATFSLIFWIGVVIAGRWTGFV